MLYLCDKLMAPGGLKTNENKINFTLLPSFCLLIVDIVTISVLCFHKLAQYEEQTIYNRSLLVDQIFNVGGTI